ncbi:MAG: aminotransferase class I/II-fold pyridoxal phosphate-dependent enzyme, partial [Kiloniellales bacterium]|nr:aminotransferase class I/II-fold pyridoxal phosphate-dependent enzyme [Kiloniellales bacterium]
PSKTEAQQIVESFHELAHATDRGLILLLDDAYESFVYDEEAAQGSLFYKIRATANLLPVKLDGISKELLWYGGRVGAITIACPSEWFNKADRNSVATELDNKFRGIIRNTVSNCSTVAQSIATKALADRDRVIRERQITIEELKRRYQSIKAALLELGGNALTPDPFHGGFFCFININPESGLKATAFCDHLLRKYKVGTVPMEEGRLNGIRIAFCSVEAEDMPSLCESLKKAVADLCP